MADITRSKTLEQLAEHYEKVHQVLQGRDLDDILATLSAGVDTAGLSTAISTEHNDRLTAETNLQNNINTVSTNLATEVSARQSDVATLTTNLNTEISTRDAADSALSTSISNVDSALTAEVSARQSGDSTLQSNLNTETAARQSADATLQSNINTVSTNLTNEITDRTTADTTLTTNLNTEIATRSANDATLQTNIDNEATARAAADTALAADITALQAVVVPSSAGVGGSNGLMKKEDKEEFDIMPRFEIDVSPLEFDLTSETDISHILDGYQAPGINLTKITFKNVPAALWADESALITAANIPNGTIVQVDNYI